MNSVKISLVKTKLIGSRFFFTTFYFFHQYFSVEKENEFLLGPRRLFLLSFEPVKKSEQMLREKKSREKKIVKIWGEPIKCQEKARYMNYVLWFDHIF